MSYNNENDLETLNILIISYAALGCSEIVARGDFKFSMSIEPIT